MTIPGRVEKPYPLISEALRSGNVDRAFELLDLHPEMMVDDLPLGGTWLHNAVIYGNRKSVEAMLQRFSVNAQEARNKRRPINEAASKSNPELVRLLLDHGAILDTDESIRNPLFGAIAAQAQLRKDHIPEENHIAIVRMLLDAGIDASVRYNTDTMIDLDAMGFAEIHGRQDIAQMLAEHLYPGDPARQQQERARAAEAAERTSAHNDRVWREEQAAIDAER